MILQKLIDTYFFTTTNSPHHSLEGSVVSAIVALTSFALFIFWNRKKALLNFQSWALLTAVINTILFIHYCPVGPHIIVQEFEYQFTPLVMVSLMFLQYLTSAVTIWRLWELSEKYIPKDIILQKQNFEDITRMHKGKRKVIARFLALWHIVKFGGNNAKDDKKIKKNIKTMVLNN